MHRAVHRGGERAARRRSTRSRRTGSRGVPFGDSWLFGVSLLAEACVDLGDAERAAELYELLLPFRELVAVSPIDGSNGASTASSACWHTCSETTSRPSAT